MFVFFVVSIQMQATTITADNPSSQEAQDEVVYLYCRVIFIHKVILN